MLLFLEDCLIIDSIILVVFIGLENICKMVYNYCFWKIVNKVMYVLG